MKIRSWSCGARGQGGIRGKMEIENKKGAVCRKGGIFGKVGGVKGGKQRKN